MEVKQYDGGGLQYLVVEPDEYDSAQEYPLIILLHGFGSHMGDLVGLTSAISRTGYLFACPNAPIAMEIGMGQVGYAWADLNGDSYEQEAQDSDDRLMDFVEEVTDQYNVAPDQIVLGGFSQGGMMTYRVGLPRPQRFTGLFALSSMVRNPEGLVGRLPELRDQPVFVSHGTQDTMILVRHLKESLRLLREWGYAFEYHEYDMGHEIRQEVVDDLVSWLHGVAPPLS